MAGQKKKNCCTIFPNKPGSVTVAWFPPWVALILWLKTFEPINHYLPFLACLAPHQRTTIPCCDVWLSLCVVLTEAANALHVNVDFFPPCIRRRFKICVLIYQPNTVPSFTLRTGKDSAGSECASWHYKAVQRLKICLQKLNFAASLLFKCDASRTDRAKVSLWDLVENLFKYFLLGSRGWLGNVFSWRLTPSEALRSISDLLLLGHLLRASRDKIATWGVWSSCRSG